MPKYMKCSMMGRAMPRRREPIPKGMYVSRQYAVKLDGTVMTFECGRCGYRYEQDYGKVRPGRGPGVIAPILLQRFLRYWSRENNGVSGPCTRCKRRAQARLHRKD